MAVTAVNKIRQSAEYVGNGTRVTELYRVEFDAVPSDVRDALDASFGGTTVPSEGDTYQGDTYLRCKRVGPANEADGSRLVYEVPVEYSTPTGSGVLITDDPLNRPPEITWSFDVVERAVEKDRDDNDIVNSAGDPFDPPITDEEYRLTCTIERNVSFFDPATAYNLINTVNDAGVTIAGVSVSAGQALLKDYSATAVYDSTTDYIREHIVVQFAATHAREVPNIGWYYIDASDSSKRKHVTDGEGRDDTRPHYIKTTSTAGDDNGQTATYLTFNIKAEANWGILNLPAVFPAV